MTDYARRVAEIRRWVAGELGPHGPMLADIRTLLDALTAAEAERDHVRKNLERIQSHLKYSVAERDRLAGKLDRLDTMHAGVCKRLGMVEAALLKINDIRNSIIGYQNVGWSQHIYPLVATLEEAGIAGLGYEEAKAGIHDAAEHDARRAALEQMVREMVDCKNVFDMAARMRAVKDALAALDAKPADEEVRA